MTITTSRVERVAKHGQKGDPGYFLLHPNSRQTRVKGVKYLKKLPANNKIPIGSLSERRAAKQIKETRDLFATWQDSDAEDIWEMNLANGISSYIKSVEKVELSRRNTNEFVTIEGEFSNKKGEVIGRFIRQIKPNGVVHNDEFFLDKKYQGKGIGKEFFMRSRQNYINAGMKKITVTPGSDVGGYAWAKMGFDIDYNYEGKMSTFERIRQMATPTRALRRFADDSKNSVKHTKAVTKLLADTNNQPTMAQILSLPDGIAKRILMGTNWHGEMSLAGGIAKIDRIDLMPYDRLKLYFDSYPNADGAEWDEDSPDDAYWQGFFGTASREERIEKVRKIRVGTRRWGGRGRRGWNPDQPRDPGGEGGGQWIKGVPEFDARTDARARRAAHINARGTETGYVKPKNSAITINPMQSDKLPKTATKQERARVDKWARGPEGVLDSDVPYAGVITRLASQAKGGETQNPLYRVSQAKKNLIANDPSLADPKNAKALSQKMIEETSRLLGIEKRVMAELFPAVEGPERTSRQDRVRRAGKLANMTVLQSKAVIRNANNNGVRLKPSDPPPNYTSRRWTKYGPAEDKSKEYRFPTRMVKAVLGPNKGKYVKVNANGDVTPVPDADVARLKAEGKEYWDKDDASSKQQRAEILAKPLPVDTQAGDDGLIKTSRDARRTRARYLATQIEGVKGKLNPSGNIDPDDSFIQVTLTGDKTLLQDQNWQNPRYKVNAVAWAALQEARKRLKEFSVPNSEAYIARNADPKSPRIDARPDAEIRQAFKDSRKALTEEIRTLKEKYPELSPESETARQRRISERKPLSPQTQAIVDAALNRADASIASADQTATVRTDRRGKPRQNTAKEIAEDIKNEEERLESTRAERERRNNDPDSIRSSRSRRSAGAGSGRSRGPSGPGRVAGKAFPPRTVYDSVEDKVDSPSITLGDTTVVDIPDEHIATDSSKNTGYTFNKNDFIWNLTDAQMDQFKEDTGVGFAPAERNKYAGIMKDPDNEFGVIATYRRQQMVRKVDKNGDVIHVPALDANGDPKYKKDGTPLTKTISVPALDDKGNPKFFVRQNKYTDERKKDNNDRKDARVLAISSKLPKFDKELKTEMFKSDIAAAVALMRMLGIRVGSSIETQKSTYHLKSQAVKDAQKAAGKQQDWIYGATTLRRRHVAIKNGRVMISFNGKGNHENMHNTTNPDLVKLFKHLLSKAGKSPEAEITQSATNETTNEYIDQRIEGITNHNLRTYLSNVIAAREITKIKTPTSPTEYYAARNKVLLIVSDVLNNKPGQAYDTYINKAIWSYWKDAAGVTD